jgi:signal transduction histidine kinase
MLAREARRLATLVDQLLDLSRLEAQAVRIQPRRLRVREHIDRTLAEIALEQRLGVVVDVPDSLETSADAVALERIISNLVVNALRHGAPPVVVSAARVDRHLRVTVVDEGPGIPDELRPRLFDQFARGDSSSGQPGSGLGLAIARSYARAHGGDLFYEPGRSGVGAKFELVLPAEYG